MQIRATPRQPSSMIFRGTKLSGVFEIDLEPKPDERGYFARTWCQEEFAAHGLNTKLVQCGLSFNTAKGTLRGMHYQVAPRAECKMVRCTKGAIFDVVLDLRLQSPTFKHWVAVILTTENRKSVYVPEGCAHGFLTLETGTEVYYQMSEFQSPELARGVRFDDPAFRIDWPGVIEVISERDRCYPDFE